MDPDGLDDLLQPDASLLAFLAELAQCPAHGPAVPHLPVQVLADNLLGQAQTLSDLPLVETLENPRCPA